MKLGENILKFRKKCGLSQEQLGDLIDVTRQTISNWELGSTTPNPEQLKQLSNVFHVSIDELLDNDIIGVLEAKVSNTEKLAGLIIKIVKGIGIALIVFFLIDVIALILFIATGKGISVESSASTVCTINDTKYGIEFGTDNYFNCDNCSDEMENDLKQLVNFNAIDQSLDAVETYFINHNGHCLNEK